MTRFERVWNHWCNFWMAVVVVLGVYMIVHPEGSGGLFGFTIYVILPLILGHFAKY